MTVVKCTKKKAVTEHYIRSKMPMMTEGQIDMMIEMLEKGTTVSEVRDRFCLNMYEARDLLRAMNLNGHIVRSRPAGYGESNTYKL